MTSWQQQCGFHGVLTGHILRGDLGIKPEVEEEGLGRQLVDKADCSWCCWAEVTGNLDVRTAQPNSLLIV